jgi:ribosomal-protein-alanine N-acetyltransferase
VIRPLTVDDAPELARILAANRRALAPFQPELPDDFWTVAGQRERIRLADCLYAILDAEALAGTIGLSNLARGPFQSATVGYWVDDAKRGRGVATEAVCAMADLAFGKLGLHRLEAACLVDNIASQRVLEKSGFVRIGVAPRYLCIAGSWRDHVLFQRTRED